jgi:hypothetical protein
MNEYRELLRELVGACEVLTRSTYRWFGSRIEVFPSANGAALSDADAESILEFSLKNRLYADFYLSGRPQPSHAAALPSHPLGSSFVGELSMANAGTGSIDAGWKVSERQGETLVVERHGLRIWAGPRDVANARDEGEGSVALLMPKELLRLSPGFYMALSNAAFPDNETHPQVRIYFNLDARAAVAAMTGLTASLNQAGIAFRFKVLADPAHYRRADAGVLYLRAQDLKRTQSIVDSVRRGLDPPLKPGGPALTLSLAEGLSFAESPADPSESFGTARAQLLAAGLIRAWRHSAASASERLRAIEECFEEAGLSLETPYRNPVRPHDIEARRA